MKRLYLNTFRNRLIISFVVIIVIPITTFNSFSFLSQNKFLLNDTTMYLQQTVDQTNKLLDEKLVEVDKRTWPLFSNNSLSIFNEALDNLSYDYYKRFFSFKKDILLSVTGDRTDVQSVNFISNNGNFFSSKNMFIKPESISPEIEEKINSKLAEKPLKMIWMGEERPLIIEEGMELPKGQDVNSTPRSYPSIMAVKRIISTKTGEELGKIIINFKDGFLSNILGTSTVGIKARIFILDEDNRYLHTDLPDMLFKTVEPELAELVSSANSGYGDISISGRKYLGIYNTSINSGWKILVLVTEDDLLEKNKGLFKYTIVVIAVGCIAFILIATFIALWISRPITEIKSVMETIADDGDLDARIKFNAIEEFQILARRFNKMMDRIQELMEKNRQIEKEKNLAEIKAMQMQVNPHFLYNTLNSIYSLSRQYGLQPIMDMTYSLSMLFRVIFSKTSELVTVRESIEQLEYYLTIQRIRFEDKFKVIYDIEEEVYDCKIPGLMIQMLVENSLVHGIEKKKDRGEINIVGYRLKGMVKIVVQDDGVGIGEERLEKIRKAMLDDRPEREEDMIALRNINRRLRLNYGNGFGLNIFSIQGKGTTVEMLLPEIR